MRKRCSIQQGEKDDCWSEQSPENRLYRLFRFFRATRHIRDELFQFFFIHIHVHLYDYFFIVWNKKKKKRYGTQEQNKSPIYSSLQHWREMVPSSQDAHPDLPLRHPPEFHGSLQRAERHIRQEARSVCRWTRSSWPLSSHHLLCTRHHMR